MSENGNRPRGRKRNVTGQAGEIHKQEADLGTGPVGQAQQVQGRPVQSSAQRPVSQQRPMNQQAAPQRPVQQAAQRPVSSQRPVSQQAAQRPVGSQRPVQQAASQRPMSSQRPASQQAAPQHRPVIYSGPQQHSASSGGGRASGGGTRASGTGASRGGCLPLIILLVVVLLGGGGALSGLFGGGLDSLLGGSTSTSTNSTGSNQSAASLLDDLLGAGTGTSSSSSSSSSSFGSGSQTWGAPSASSTSVMQSLLGSGSWYSMFGGADSASSVSGVRTDSTALNTKVAAGSRDKFTAIKGDGKDKITLMIYMCGADLESRSGMATRDLQEMMAATLGSRLNLIIYTGGCTRWKNDAISSSVNQIWQIKNKKLVCLEKDMGTAAMTSPDTLRSFLEYGAKNFKADRYQLILWDHGSGSVTGYGYDEKNQRAGSMSLAGINSALKASGLRFDFIGFDACLMATVENALMLSNYADYMIASEETEPGIGWYYTNWLSQLGGNTSLSTLEVGKIIADDFTAACRQSCPGQTTTLSVVDLAEVAATVPEKLTAFSRSMTDLMADKEYTAISNARNGSREFASSSKTDMVDLTDLANRLGNDQGTALASVLKSAVKYNRSTVSNAYGLSIFFPYKKVSSVDKAVSTYAAIGLDDSYSDAIRAFASIEAGGQAVSSQSGYQIPSILMSSGSGSGLSSGAYGNSDMISSLLSSFLGGSDLDFLSGRQADTESLTEYYADNMLDPSLLEVRDGVLRLPAEQWALVHSIELSLFYDDGEGYIDLGLDPVYEWDEEGNLLADTSGAWLALNGQITPYYCLGTDDDGETWSTAGTIPVLLNGWRAELLVTFDAEHESGIISGARWVYEDETDAVAKAVTEIETGDQIQLLCDYYAYDGTYQSSHMLGDPITVGEEGLVLTDLLLPDASKANYAYRLTDIYNEAYWTAPF